VPDRDAQRLSSILIYSYREWNVHVGIADLCSEMLQAETEQCATRHLLSNTM
jgi:hypothetical protein